ncbi:hypothetical protein OIU78_019083 [Salix suchowensis]|nr:hypothetical protein OIU78_019083 [Salix suchowensis]
MATETKFRPTMDDAVTSLEQLQDSKDTVLTVLQLTRGLWHHFKCIFPVNVQCIVLAKLPSRESEIQELWDRPDKVLVYFLLKREAELYVSISGIHPRCGYEPSQKLRMRLYISRGFYNALTWKGNRCKSSFRFLLP